MAQGKALIDVRLVKQPVEYAPIEPFPTAAGGECVFLGRTREEAHPTHGGLVRLSYEAYEPMARSVLESLAAQAAHDWNCLAVRIHHAIGDVPIGSASVLVQTVCGHRAAAFDACRFLIDRLKVEAPIWKHEQWADGTTWARGEPVAADLRS